MVVTMESEPLEQLEDEDLSPTNDLEREAKRAGILSRVWMGTAASLLLAGVLNYGVTKFWIRDQVDKEIPNIPSEVAHGGLQFRNDIEKIRSIDVEEYERLRFSEEYDQAGQNWNIYWRTEIKRMKKRDPIEDAHLGFLNFNFNEGKQSVLLIFGGALAFLRGRRYKS